MRTSSNTNEIAAALAKAQGEIKIAIKDSNNPFFKSKYADLVTIVKASRDALSKNALAVIQGLSAKDQDWILETRLEHSSGQWYETDFPIYIKEKTSQAIGSAVTYGKRYSLAAIIGVVSDDEDDDGETAVGRGKIYSKPHINTPVNTPGMPVKKEEPKPNVKGFAMSAVQKAEIKILAEHAGMMKDTFLPFLREVTGKESSEYWTESDYNKAVKALKDHLDPEKALDIAMLNMPDREQT